MDKHEAQKKAQEYLKTKRYKFLNYDRKRYIQLLNEQKEKVRCDELKFYLLVLVLQLNWETKEQYLTLLEKYTKNKLKVYNFEESFKKLYFSVEEIAELLESNRIILSPHKKSFDFELLLDKIHNYLNRYAPDPEESYEVGKDEFDAAIKKIYLDMQNLLDEE